MYRQRRNQEWVIAEQDDGSYQVWHGRRMITSGLQSVRTAETIVADNRRVNERVWLAATDGYRTELTRKFKDPAPQPQRAIQADKRPTPPEVDPHPVRTRYLARYGRTNRDSS